MIHHIEYDNMSLKLFPVSSILATSWDVAVFFCLSGFFVKEENMQDVIPFMKKKIKQLWIPLFVYVALATVLHNYFISIGFLSDTPYTLKQMFLQWSKVFLCAGYDYLFPLWFVRTLIYAFFGLSALSWLLKRFISKYSTREWIRALIILSAAMVSNVCVNKFSLNISSISNIPTAMWLIYFGYLLRNVVQVKFNNMRLLVGACIVGYYLTVMYGGYDINRNEFSDMVTLTIISFSYLYIVCYISQKIENTFIGAMYAECGRMSYHIMAIHPIAFKIVTSVLLACGLTSSVLSPSSPKPLCYESCWLVVIYILGGIIIPIIVVKPCIKGVNILHSRLSRK